MKLKPLADRVILKQFKAEEKTKSGLILAASAQEKPEMFEVVEVGPGGMVDGNEVVMTLKVGDKVTLLGRFQSRAYQKQLPDGTVIGKTAYEVSVGRLTMADAAPQPAPFVIHPEETHTVETLVQPSTPVQVNPFTTPTT